MVADVNIYCAECGAVLTKDPELGWTDGGDPMMDPPRAGVTCPSGWEPSDRHVPDVDIPDNLEPATVEEWLAT